MQDSVYTIPFGELLGQYRLGLVVVAGASGEMRDREVRWVHASELEDPTPFLPPRTVLLTTGARFAELPEREDADAYVRRLIEADTSAIGVAVGLHWDRIPDRFVSACDAQGLPLFRVPYDTAFIEIVQTAASLIEAQRRERDTWALESQRAVAGASLADDGLHSTLREASARLGRWVWVSNPAGHPIAISAAPAGATPPHRDLQREVRRLRKRGVSSIRVEGKGESGFRLQALGRQGEMLGVLAVEDQGAPDTAERTVLELVTALSTAQLEHRNALGKAHATLRAAMARLLLEGHATVAERLTDAALPPLPRGTVAVVRPSAGDTGSPDPLASILQDDSSGALWADYDGAPVLIVETRRLPGLRRRLTDIALPSGISSSGSRDHLPALLGEADRALAHAKLTGQQLAVDYSPSMHEGMLHLLGAVPDAREHANALLSPVREHDAKHGDSVAKSLEVWLAHHGQTSPAAAELGVHRHTLRNRITTAAELLQLDLDSPDARADLWAALRLTSSD